MDQWQLISWGMDWAWGLPLIVLTVVFHAFGLGFISRRVTSTLAGESWLQDSSAVSVLVMGGSGLWAITLHAFESFLWALAYLFLGALRDIKTSILYSLGAMTTYGHENLVLAPSWRLMGALQPLDGWILFGLTTAFLFSIMQKAWPRT